MKSTRRLFSALGLAWLVFCGAALAQKSDVSAADAKQIRAVVQAQLDAFAADDARRAFSYAAPAIREMFGTADKFMAMVRAGYPAVVRPTSVVFFTPERVAGELIQVVELTDAAGSVWRAIYQMQRQRDKSWRINGCQVVPSPGRVT